MGVCPLSAGSIAEAAVLVACSGTVSTQYCYAGRRTDFRDKNRAMFSGELFSGEELLPENSFLGQ